MECDSSGYSSCSSSTLLGFKKWPHNNKMQVMQSADCAAIPECSEYTGAFKYYDLRYNRRWKDDPTMEKLERQQLLNRKRKRTRQLHFDSTRSIETGTEESASSSEANCDTDEFINTVVIQEEEHRDFTDDDLIMSEEQVAPTQIESNAYRIDIQVYTPESLIDVEIESELSDSEISFLESDSDNEHEEDGYLTSEFFENDSDSDGEQCEDSLTKIANILTDGEIVRHRFPFLSMRIFLDDFMCLMSDEFVNDTIMDFCLNNLVFNRVPEDLYKVHALPSTFWYILQLQLLEDPSQKNDTLAEKLMRRYSKLAGFIEQVDLFEQDFIVVPINDQNHWSLCVICCPNRLLNSESTAVDQSNVIDPHSSILMFDLQPSNQATLMKYGQQVREFLQFAYLYQNGHSDDLAERFSDSKCPVVVPTKLPKQANPYDCGIYALEFANCFFKNPPNMRKVSEGNFELLVEYPAFSVSNKRCHLREEILSLSTDRVHFEELLGYRS